MININQPILGEEERREVDSIIKSGYLTTGAREGGPKVREFEGSLAKYLGVKHVVAINSGTSALYASLIALGIGHRDKVLVPSFTFLATANAVLMTGAKPVFVDVRKDYNMDPNDLKKRISKDCKAVIPVHLYGYPAKIDEINEIARSAEGVRAIFSLRHGHDDRKPLFNCFHSRRLLRTPRREIPGRAYKAAC